MDKETTIPIDEQAAQIETLLPRIARRLFTLDQSQSAYELPVAQLRVCSVLLGGKMPITHIADELSISVSAATQIADRLEKAGLVERTCEGTDRRVKYLSLKPEGVQMMRARRVHRVERARAAIESLSEDQRTSILAALNLLFEASIELPPSNLDLTSPDTPIIA